MKILVAGNVLFSNFKSGVYQYTRRLLEATLELDQKNSYTVFGFLFIGKKMPAPPLALRPNLKYKFIRYLPGRVYSRLHKKLLAPPVDLLLNERPDIVFFPHFVRYPLASSAKSIVVIYDLSYVYQSQYSDAKNKWYMERFVPRSIKKADHIVTISQNSQKEIIDYYKVDPAKISVVTPAVNHEVFFRRSEAEVNQVKAKYGINGSFILYTGTLEPRKNINGLLDAYVSLPAAIQDNFTLVLAGGKGWLDQDIKRRLDELSGLKIITTGYVPDEDLPALYSGAAVFVYPSFYEGFGMPPLEAMACGAPVISSNNTSLPEVVGDAGILVEATDIAGISSAITRVLTDIKLAKEMSKKGLVQAKKFSWSKSAQNLVQVFQDVGK